ncbi:MAG TPA: glucosamine-6-phosphate deaminase [Vicinamibacterales bacterium]|nr:glucosamine-6-phosphate deaminase [Vicinamibacterales bacterium]
MNCEAFPTAAALSVSLARRVLDAIRRNPSIVLGLPTGRTPLRLYQELVRLSAAEQLDWSRVRTFNLDEFVGLGQGDPGSYRTFMDQRLFSHVDIAEHHLGFLDGRGRDLAAECERYERAIAGAGGIDLLLLGIGANGHIGFNEPAEALAARTHVVTLDEPSRHANALWFDGDARRVPRQALTMGMGTILRARTIVLMATGETKEEAVTAMFEGGVTTRLPASFLQLHPQVTIMLDQPLAARTDC